MSALKKAHDGADAPAEQTGAPAPGGIKRRLKNMALFFAAPFITLAYAVMLPAAGLRWLKQLRDNTPTDARG